MSKQYRITSTPRFIAFLVVCALLIIYLTTAVLGISTADGATKELYTYIEVAPGDTLWEIAAEYKDEDTEIRKYIHKVCELNDIKAGDLQAGDVIKIPTTL